jgi:hypothetical protein
VGAAIALVLTLASLASAGAPDDIGWLTTFEVAPGVEVGVWTLVESTSVWPTALGRKEARAIEAGQLQHFSYVYRNKGDYLRVIVDVEDGAVWRPKPETHAVFCYPERDVVSIEYVFFSFDIGSRDLARTVLSSRDGVVLDPAVGGLMRSSDGGFRGYLRFPPGSLPRPKRSWWGGGGNRWGVTPPDSVQVRRGGDKR